MDPIQQPPESVEPSAQLADGDLEPAAPGPEPAPAPVHFWRALLVSIAAHTSLAWVLDGIPVTGGEALVLRWLRALAEHPIRGPLGLALGFVALRQIVRAALNRTSLT